VRGWLLDTNILSELRRPRPAREVVGFVAAQPSSRLFASTAAPGGSARILQAVDRPDLLDFL